ncbi:MAG: small multi-drug export protein [Clostridia bacterium]|nr:small multi-drug export protein [Clostridia bacterium]
MLSFEEWQILLMSAVPFTELRLTIPLAIALGIEPLKAFFLACTGNFLPIIPLLLLLEPMTKIIAKIPILDKILNSIITRTRSKGEQVEKYGALGLLLFVAVPLPGTGVYSAAILAFLFGIRFWYSFISLTLGMLVAGVVVTLASAGIMEIAQYIYKVEYIMLALLGIGLIYWFLKRKK